MTSIMDKDNMYVILGSAFLVVAIFLIFSMANSPESNLATGMVTGSSSGERCSDGTPVYQCSEDSLGNMCFPSKDGTELRFSDKCYE
jgi:hypothetical protein